MNWYLTKLVFIIDTENNSGPSDSQNQKAQFDEQLRLIHALDESDAYFKAKSIGKKQQSQFSNASNETVTWRFVDVSEIVLVAELKDGVEVYSTTHETYEKENFINSVRSKGMAIQTRNLFLC